MSNRPSPPAHVARTRVDISLLQLSDRACLRLLEHSRVCTATQLGNLLYPSQRTTLGAHASSGSSACSTESPYLAEQGGIPVAYRLESIRTTPPPPQPISIAQSRDRPPPARRRGVRHRLHRQEHGLVHLWWPESIIPNSATGHPPRPARHHRHRRSLGGIDGDEVMRVTPQSKSGKPVLGPPELDKPRIVATREATGTRRRRASGGWSSRPGDRYGVEVDTAASG